MSDENQVVCPFSNSEDVGAILSDPLLSQFFDPSCDPSVGTLEHPSSVGHNLIKIGSAIDVINQELRTFVSDNFEQLISQSNQLESSEATFRSIQAKIDDLLSSLELLRNKLGQFYSKISHRIVLLNRLKSTCDLLRKMIRIMNVTSRLDVHHLLEVDSTGSHRELSKHNQQIRELDSLIESDPLLLEIEVLQKDVSLIRRMKEKLDTINDDPKV